MADNSRECAWLLSCSSRTVHSPAPSVHLRHAASGQEGKWKERGIQHWKGPPIFPGQASLHAKDSTSIRMGLLFLFLCKESSKSELAGNYELFLSAAFKKRKSEYLFYLVIYWWHVGQAQTNFHEMLLPYYQGNWSITNVHILVMTCSHTSFQSCSRLYQINCGDRDENSPDRGRRRHISISYWPGNSIGPFLYDEQARKGSTRINAEDYYFA